MNKQVFELQSEFIPLSSLLKVLGIAGTGGHAKMMITSGEVFVNSEVEERIRRKLREGDVVSIGNEIEIEIKAAKAESRSGV